MKMDVKLRISSDDLKDYLLMTIGVLFYTIGWGAFMLPYQITVGGVAGVSNIVYFVSKIPVDVTYFLINATLMVVALKVLGWRFMVKTIYCILAITFMLRVVQLLLKQSDGSLLQLMGPHESFMACIIGSALCGIGLGFIFMQNGSTGGTDILAAIVNKYRDIDNDIRAGKVTLVVRLGKRASLRLYLFLGIIAVLLIFLVELSAYYVCGVSHYMAAVLSAFYLIPHLFTWRKMKRIDAGRKLNEVLGDTARNILIFGLLTSLGLLL